MKVEHQAEMEGFHLRQQLVREEQMAWRDLVVVLEGEVLVEVKLDSYMDLQEEVE